MLTDGCIIEGLGNNYISLPGGGDQCEIWWLTGPPSSRLGISQTASQLTRTAPDAAFTKREWDSVAQCFSSVCIWRF